MDDVGSIDARPERDCLLTQAQSLPLRDIVPNEGPVLRGIGMLEDGDEEVLRELEAAGELGEELPDAVEEEKEGGGVLLLRVLHGRGRVGVAGVDVTAPEGIPPLNPFPLDQGLE